MAGLFFIEVGNNVGGTGWNLAITAGAGAQPTFASDVGELDISFSSTDVERSGLLRNTASRCQRARGCFQGQARQLTST